ncbi:MAG: glycosyl transferase [Burkholderiales bacterium]|nr:glycosyl transferase [Burkholderiales bacterium]
MTGAPQVTVSIVSHGQRGLLVRLLSQLRQWHDGAVVHVVVTHNLPDPQPPLGGDGWPFRLTEIRNPEPLGFGANHNQAFRQCGTPWFCVLNPDVELDGPGVWTALLHGADGSVRACIYPPLANADGTLQDNERAAVTPLSLWRRHIQRLPEQRLDWASAAFWLLPAQTYGELGGFDERYFMYCEDTDFCLRLQLAGGRLVRAGRPVVHHAGRSSRSSPRHLAWHLRSLLRLWTSPVLRRYLATRRAQ